MTQILRTSGTLPSVVIPAASLCAANAAQRQVATCAPTKHGPSRRYCYGTPGIACSCSGGPVLLHVTQARMQANREGETYGDEF